MENDSFQGIAKIKAAVRPSKPEPMGRVSKDSQAASGQGRAGWAGGRGEGTLAGHPPPPPAPANCPGNSKHLAGRIWGKADWHPGGLGWGMPWSRGPGGNSLSQPHLPLGCQCAEKYLSFPSLGKTNAHEETACSLPGASCQQGAGSSACRGFWGALQSPVTHYAHPLPLSPGW